MSDAPRYELTTIADLLRVPADRREACVRDLLYALLVAELAFGDEAYAAFKGTPFAWVDDNDHSVTLNGEDGEFLRLEVTGTAHA